jgi:hypothetical protein
VWLLEPNVFQDSDLTVPASNWLVSYYPGCTNSEEKAKKYLCVKKYIWTRKTATTRVLTNSPHKKQLENEVSSHTEECKLAFTRAQWSICKVGFADSANWTKRMTWSSGLGTMGGFMQILQMCFKMISTSMNNAFSKFTYAVQCKVLFLTIIWANF